MLVAAKLDKVNSVNIQTMIDNHTDTNVTLCTDEATIYKGEMPLRSVTLDSHHKCNTQLVGQRVY
jgi:hypothetical protein